MPCLQQIMEPQWFPVFFKLKKPHTTAGWYLSSKGVAICSISGRSAKHLEHNQNPLSIATRAITAAQQHALMELTIKKKAKVLAQFFFAPRAPRQSNKSPSVKLLVRARLSRRGLFIDSIQTGWFVNFLTREQAKSARAHMIQIGMWRLTTQ